MRTLYNNFQWIDVGGRQKPNYMVKTDMKRMQQVLLNLYSNAVKFTPRNGKISIVVDLLLET